MKREKSGNGRGFRIDLGRFLASPSSFLLAPLPYTPPHPSASGLPYPILLSLSLMRHQTKSISRKIHMDPKNTVFKIFYFILFHIVPYFSTCSTCTFHLALHVLSGCRYLHLLLSVVYYQYSGICHFMLRGHAP